MLKKHRCLAFLNLGDLLVNPRKIDLANYPLIRVSFTMSGFHSLTTAEQAAAYLRGELEDGKIVGLMPGVLRLEAELGVNRKTVETALRLLEKKGFLVPQGPGRRRKILLPENLEPPQLRVGILLYEKEDSQLGYIGELLRQLQQRGYLPFLSNRSLIDLGMDEQRVAAFVAQNSANAWVVIAGSRKVLEWFSRQSIPAFALHGRQPSVAIAGTAARKSTAMATTVRRLAELGHSRIVLLSREERRKPVPGIVEQAFLDELQTQGITVGSYNLPDWQDNSEGFSRCLTSLFRHTAPTALIIDAMELFTAAQQFLLHQGIRVPQDVSIVCGDPHPSFSWCHPTVAHISYDSRIWVRNTMRWVNNVARGENDRRQVISKSKFIEGGTVGVVPIEPRIEK